MGKKMKRNSIHREFCECWGGKILTVSNKTHFFMADGLSTEELSNFLWSVKATPTMFFSDAIEKCQEQVTYLLDLGIPVVLETKSTVPGGILEKMAEVEHSGLHVHIDSLRDFTLNSLDEGFGDVFALQEQLSIAKSWRIFTALAIDYKPHIISRLALYEIIEVFRNQISHVLVECSSITDDDSRIIQDKWDTITGTTGAHLKKYYKANVKDRTWDMKSNFMESEMNELREYLRIRKITLDVLQLENVTSGNRIRHTGYGFHKRPMGMRPFIAIANGDTFENVDISEINLGDYVCPKCNKQVFEYRYADET